ncbi:MAG: tetratricopeptide repeat protein [Bauldia sp.]
MYRPILLSLGLILLASAGAHAGTAVEDDCLSADPRFAVEACTAALQDGSERSAIELFRLHAAEADAELGRGGDNLKYAMVEFDAALGEVEKDGGASPPDAEYADFLAQYAVAYLRNSDPAKALDLLGTVAATDPANARAPLLTAFAHFAAGGAGQAGGEAAALLAKAPKDGTLVALKSLAEQWVADPVAAVAQCKKYFPQAECGAAALPLYGKEHAAADLVSSILGEFLRRDVRRMSREEAPGAWNDCDAPEPQYAGVGCDQILSGLITPEERYEAQVKRILAFIHNDDAWAGITEAEHLIARVGYGVARPADDGPDPAAARALLAQAHLQRGEIDEAAKVLDDALADEPDNVTYLALRGLVDLADRKAEDAEANLGLAFDYVSDDDPSDVSVVSGVVSAAASSAEEGVASCKDAYPDAPCGADELAAGDGAAALAAIAASINDYYLGSAERRFTLIGVDEVP